MMPLRWTWCGLHLAVNGAPRCWLQVLGDLLCYPNRMAFDIMPGGGKAPEPKGLLVVKVKAVTNIKGGGDLFSKARTPPAAPALPHRLALLH